ncbi:MAG: hypothetical protein N4A61_12980 [Pelagimonas sp.]|jgi:O-antigen ligase|nr:hypothetical protein [Pelagimonas sp.]
MTRLPPPLLISLVVISAIVVAAGIVVFDPILSNALPGMLLALTGLGKAPLQFVPVVLGGLLIWRLARRGLIRLGSFEQQAIVVLLLAAQLNGLSAGPLDMFDLALFGYFFLWLGSRALDPERALYFPPVVVLGGILLAVSVAHLMVQSPLRWFIGTFGVFRAVLLAFLIVDLCRSTEAVQGFLRAVFWLAGLTAVLGITQFLLAYLNIFIFTLIDPPETAFKPTPIGFVMRASGFAITAQHYASFLVFSVPFILLRISDGLRLGHLALLGLVLGGIMVSWNFGSFLTTALICVVFPFVRWPQYLGHLVMAVLAVLALAYFTGILEFAYSISFGDNGVAKGVDQRKTLFELGIDKVMRNPLVGTGPQAFASGDGNFWGRPVHNALGQTAAELGLLGTFALLAIVIYLLVSLSVIAVTGGANGPMAAAGFALVLAFTQLMQSEPNMDNSNTWMAFGFAQALVLLHRRGIRLRVNGS